MTNFNFQNSVQINNGLKETSADGAVLIFDKKYGIMFCVYMPGMQGKYGESRGKISLSYFPASQPTNIKFVDVVIGDDVYCNNAVHINDGKIRVLYERNSKADCDHYICYKDFDFLSETLTGENIVMLKKEDGSSAPLTESEQFSYLKRNGFSNYKYLCSEQITFGGHTIFRGEDGCLYGAITSYLAEPILYRSKDNLASLEFFAIYPKLAQYEFDYKILNGKIYAIYRTDKKENCITFTTSEDNGKTWSEPVEIKESINCRPRIINYEDTLLMAYNYLNDKASNKRFVCNNRTAVKIRILDNQDPNKCTVVADLLNPWGIVNISIENVSGNVYMAYSTSEVPLEVMNYGGSDIPVIHGKDVLKYIKLGNLTE